QSYVPAGEIDRWERENDPITRYIARLTENLGFAPTDIAAVDEQVRRDVDEATDVAERSGPPQALDALVGVYAEPPAAEPLWFRRGSTHVVGAHERRAGWRTLNSSGENA